MPGTHHSKAHSRFLTAVWIAGLLAAVMYTIYACSTGTGVAGYVIQIQLALWNNAWDRVTSVVTLAVVLAAYFALMALLTRMFPSLGAKRVELANRPLTGISWLTVAFVCLTPVVVGAAVSLLWHQTALRDASAPVYSVNLAAAASPLPRDARFVEVTATLGRSYAAVYKKDSEQTVTHEVFAPLVAGQDAPSQPVRFFVHYETPESAGGPPNWPEPFLQQGATAFTGKIGRGLPPFVVSHMRSKGLVPAPAYVVIDWQDFRYRQAGVIPRDDPWYGPVAGGGFLTVILLPIMLMLRFQLARQHARRNPGVYAHVPGRALI